MELSEIIKDIEKHGIIILFTSLPDSKGRHNEINGQKYIFVDNKLSEIELINVLLHEKAHCLKDDINNTLCFVETYNYRIENETEKNRIIDFLNLINQEYPIVNCTPKVGQKKSNFWGVFVWNWVTKIKFKFMN